MAFALSAAAAAQAPAADRAASAREDIRRLDSALGALRVEYAPAARRPIAGILSDLQVRVALLEPPREQADAPRGRAWRRLTEKLDAALAVEREFWSGPAAGNAELLPPQTAEPLRRALEDLGPALATLEPSRAAGAVSATGPEAPAREERIVGAGGTSAVDQGTAVGRTAAGSPTLAFDGAVATGDVDGPQERRTRGNPIASDHPPRPHSPEDERPIKPPQRLRVDAIPSPARVRSGYTGPEARSPIFAGVGPAASGAASPRPPAGTSLGPSPIAAGPPSAASRDVGQPADPKVAACRQAAGGGMFAWACGRGYLLERGGLVAAGVVDAVKEQFGTAAGLIMNVAALIVGVLLQAASGGAGIVINLLRALCGAAFLLVVGSMLVRLGRALASLMTTRKEDPRYWQAFREVGKLGGELVILALMTFIGVKIGGRADVKAASGSMMRALEAKVGPTWVKAPPQINATMGVVEGGAPAPPPSEPPSRLVPPDRPIPKVPATGELQALGVGELSFPRSQLQHEFPHAAEFGVKGTATNPDLAAFQRAILTHIERFKPVAGKFKQTVDVYHFTDPNTGLNVMIRPDGEFLAAWKLHPIQLRNVLTRGSL